MLLSLLGLAGSAALGALLVLYPSWAGNILYLALTLFVLMFVAGVFLYYKRRSERASDNTPSITIRDSGEVDLSNNRASSGKAFLDATNIDRLVVRRNKISR